MSKTEAAKMAAKLMSEGRNCCETVIIIANETWDLKLPPEVLQSGHFFRDGMGSGCSCGALVGLIMISSILHARYGHPQGRKLAAELHDRFKASFGSTCCRVICRKRPVTEKIGKRGCKILTGHTVEILLETWEDIVNGKTQNLSDYSHP